MIGDIYFTENLIPLVNQLISQLALQEISQLYVDGFDWNFQGEILKWSFDSGLLVPHL